MQIQSLSASGVVTDANLVLINAAAGPITVQLPPAMARLEDPMITLVLVTPGNTVTVVPSEAQPEPFYITQVEPAKTLMSVGAYYVIVPVTVGEAPTPSPETLLGHSDFPSSYSGAALKLLRVNAGATAVEFTPDGVFATGDHSHAEATALVAGFMPASAVSKLETIEDGAQVNVPQVNADWNAVGTVAEILNKPVIPLPTLGITEVVLQGDIAILTPTVNKMHVISAETAQCVITTPEGVKDDKLILTSLGSKGMSISGVTFETPFNHDVATISLAERGCIALTCLAPGTWAVDYTYGDFVFTGAASTQTMIDTFTGVDETPIYQHTPDSGPFVWGDIVAMFGEGPQNAVIRGNKLDCLINGEDGGTAGLTALIGDFTAQFQCNDVSIAPVTMLQLFCNLKFAVPGEDPTDGLIVMLTNQGGSGALVIGQFIPGDMSPIHQGAINYTSGDTVTIAKQGTSLTVATSSGGNVTVTVPQLEAGNWGLGGYAVIDDLNFSATPPIPESKSYVYPGLESISGPIQADINATLDSIIARGDTLIYMSPTGSDANDGLTAVTPVQSLPKAVEIASGMIAATGSEVTIDVAKGHDYPVIGTPIELKGSGKINIWHNYENPYQYGINGSAITAIGSNEITLDLSGIWEGLGGWEVNDLLIIGNVYCGSPSDTGNAVAAMACGIHRITNINGSIVTLARNSAGITPVNAVIGPELTNYSLYLRLVKASFNFVSVGQGIIDKGALGEINVALIGDSPAVSANLTDDQAGIVSYCGLGIGMAAEYQYNGSELIVVGFPIGVISHGLLNVSRIATQNCQIGVHVRGKCITPTILTAGGLAGMVDASVYTLHWVSVCSPYERQGHNLHVTKNGSLDSLSQANLNGMWGYLTVFFWGHMEELEPSSGYSITRVIFDPFKRINWTGVVLNQGLGAESIMASESSFGQIMPLVPSYQYPSEISGGSIDNPKQIQIWHSEDIILAHYAYLPPVSRCRGKSYRIRTMGSDARVICVNGELIANGTYLDLPANTSLEIMARAYGWDIIEFNNQPAKPYLNRLVGLPTGSYIALNDYGYRGFGEVQCGSNFASFEFTSSDTHIKLREASGNIALADVAGNLCLMIFNGQLRILNQDVMDTARIRIFATKE